MHSDFCDKSLPNDKGCHLIEKGTSQFKFEKLEIELPVEKLGADVNFPPEGHCEIAGRGVERLWYFSKILFCEGNVTLENDKRVNNLNQ